MRVVAPILLLTLVGGLGFLVAVYLYQEEFISWSAADPTTLLVLGIALGLLTLLVLASLVLSQSFAILRRSLSVVTALGSGFLGGLAIPAAGGEVPIWLAPPESVLYKLDIYSASIDQEVLDQVNSPLTGERSVLNYVAALPDGGLVMVSSAGTEVFDLPETQSEASFEAVLSVWNSDLERQSQVSLTEQDSRIQLVRGIYFDSDASRLYFSVQPFNQECNGLELWSAVVEIDTGAVTDSEVLFQTTPCLDSVSGPERFGGRVTMSPDGTVYLSTGDFGYGVSTTREEMAEGVYEERPAELQEPHSLGAIVAVEPSGESRVVSRGHRNPQGLHFDRERNLLWESEHGPKGGDELNLITEGLDYGWPDVTYGGPYGGSAQPDQTWAVDRWYGMNHGSYEEPIMTWLPAIAASQLMVYRGDKFPAWQGDVLLSAFRGDIHRVRVIDGRAVFDEVIPIGTRPRDLVELANGSLLVTSDLSEFVLVSQPSS